MSDHPEPIWLSEEEYQYACKTVPIVSVDVLPYRLHNGGLQVGMISRDDEKGGISYAVVGGGIKRNETAAEAIERHIISTLGDKVTFNKDDYARQPDAVGQYFPDVRDGYLVDSRKHSVGLTWLVEINGDIEPEGEATEFTWFDLKDLPADEKIGYRQGSLVRELVDLLQPITLADIGLIDGPLSDAALKDFGDGADAKKQVAVLIKRHPIRVTTTEGFEDLAQTQWVFS
jgi:ADP-ribose pyrophosphatase YjhB (NUDIX family)